MNLNYRLIVIHLSDSWNPILDSLIRVYKKLIEIEHDQTRSDII
jgi:hypothetical protein